MSIRHTHGFELEDASLPEAGSTVAVGMSGGVDSTLAAALLKERGCRVVGLTMSKWGETGMPGLEGAAGGCFGPDEIDLVNDCRAFCKQNGIEYHVIDVQHIYKEKVLDYFTSEYSAGRTPNPCVRCNQNIKFGALLSLARSIGVDFDYFCTGHYARLVRPSVPLGELYRRSTCDDAAGVFAERGDPASRPLMVYRAADDTKDQSYFLCRVSSSSLERVRFLFSGMTKKEVFAQAKSRGLAAAERKESQDFLPAECFSALFAKEHPAVGDFVDESGKVVGQHRGIQYYTVGQRRGLGLSAPRPLYVRSIDKQTNRIYVSEDAGLLAPVCEADDWVWAGGYAPARAFRAEVKIRLASPAVSARIEPLERAAESTEAGMLPTVWRIRFDEPQRALAPGQALAVYTEGLLLGSGVISV